MNDSLHTEIWLTWRNLIGDFMMEFSEIEYISYSLWVEQKVNKDKTPPNKFRLRTKQVISQLNNTNDNEIKLILERSIKLAEKRNTIAHNPTLLQIFENETTNELHREFAISTFIEGDYIDLPELKELTAEAIDIKTELYMKLGYLPYENKKG